MKTLFVNPIGPIRGKVVELFIVISVLRFAYNESVKIRTDTFSPTLNVGVSTGYLAITVIVFEPFRAGTWKQKRKLVALAPST